MGKEGEIVVADRGNNRVVVFSPKGEFLRGQFDLTLRAGTCCSGPRETAITAPHLTSVPMPRGCSPRLSAVDAVASDIGDGVGSSDTQFQAPSSVRVPFDHNFAFSISRQAELEANSLAQVAIGPQGEVVVSDYGNHRVKVFTIEGELLRVLGESEDRAERLHYPAGVAVSADGILFVADSGNHRVVALTEDGEVSVAAQVLTCGVETQTQAWAAGGSRVLWRQGRRSRRPPCPVRITLRHVASQMLSAANASANATCTAAPLGALTVCVGRLGVTIGAAGEILICDSGHHRVLVLDAEGYLLYCFGFKGQDFGELQCPRGVAVGPHGMLAVADYGNHRLVLCERC